MPIPRHNLKIYLRGYTTLMYIEAKNVEHIAYKNLYKEAGAQAVKLKDLAINPRCSYFFSGDTSVTVNGKDILAIISEVNHE